MTDFVTAHGTAITNAQKRLLLSERLNYEILPGTEVLKDVDGIHLARGSHDTSLLPTPSNSEDDPLNWSTGYKFLGFAGMLLYIFVHLYPGLSCGIFYTVMGEEWGVGADKVAYFTGSQILTGGWGSIVFVPLAVVHGRRFSILLANLIGTASYIWQATAHSYGSFMGARVLNGFGAALSETVGTMIVEDLFFVHQRGAKIGLYFAITFFGANIGPFVASVFVATGTGWRNFFWLAFTTSAIAQIALLFMPDTKFHRNNEKIGVHDDQDKSSDGKPTHRELEVVDGTAHGAMLGRGKPNKAAWALYNPRDPHNDPTLLNAATFPFRLLAFPIVVWSTLVFMMGAGSILVASVNQAILFGSYGYNFSVIGQGSTNFVFLITAGIGSMSAGMFSDWYMARATARNDGVREPEMRLPAMIPYAIFLVAGFASGGAAATQGVPWPVMIFVCYGLAGIGMIGITVVAIAYSIDCYPIYSGEILVISTIVKNTFAFGLTYYIVPWVTSPKWGWQKAFGLWSACCAIVLILGIPVYYYGKTLRRISATSSLMRDQ